jgi:hypothetical protein
MPAQRKTNRVDFEMSAKTAARFAELQASVRAIGHSAPTPRTLISALIMAESRRGGTLESELLMPFRVEQEDAD